MKTDRCISQTCTYCGSRLIGRIDKKFCSNSCRIAFHNEKTPKSAFVREVNSILIKNRKIIIDLLQDQFIKKVNLSDLTEEGYRLKFFTEQRTMQNKMKVCLCYDVGLLVLNGNEALIFSEAQSPQINYPQ